MRFTRIGVPVLAAVASSAMILTGSLAPAPAPKVPAPHRHRPADIRTHRLDGTFESTNWSGYAATGTNFTRVTGSWVIPASTCATGSSAEYAAFWIGIDGWTSDSVEQTGTDSDCSNGKPSYYAWYEFYPNPSYYAGKLTNLSARRCDVLLGHLQRQQEPVLGHHHRRHLGTSLTPRPSRPPANRHAGALLRRMDRRGAVGPGRPQD